jgi:hypothetical protein
MNEKSTLTKFIELVMSCQTEQAKRVLNFIKTMPDGEEKQNAINQLRDSYNQTMNDCHNLLEAEKQYVKIKSN